ncbi:hypothetical protein [Mesorhizobium sp. B2-6-1]|uniref:hypothetical protein n=1 Tax=Mesorhizobium sp. B2-6-1 TaxID=2589916 RepID=UPI00112E6E16|nr:hypothetical protein [Mesorhizobium sp. B2-6-1]TPJ57650.1 hypothetical protein FJ443_28995 [Mesorhizobium sp. B2-6-1]
MLEIHLEPLGGMARDMFVAALLDLRPDLEPELKQALAVCPLIEDVTFEAAGHNDRILRAGASAFAATAGMPKSMSIITITNTTATITIIRTTSRITVKSTGARSAQPSSPRSWMRKL